jgi:tetratricopeptide (TPR) repeat protein
MYEFLQKTNTAAAQDFSVGGRIAWAIYCYDTGRQAMEGGNLTCAITILEEATRAFPFPISLELLGECLLREGKFVEASIYLAAAVGMSERHEFRPLFLLGKALAAAKDNHVSKIILTKAILIEPAQEALDLLSDVTRRAGI